MHMVDVDAAALDESRQFNKAIEELLANAPSIHTVSAAETRAARAEGRGTFPAPVVVPEGRDRSIPGLDGGPEVGLREFVPPGDVRGVYLHIHGGGWVLGDARSQDTALWRLANEASVAVVSVEYRLAPEHPFPAGPDDCEAAALWLVSNAAHEYGADAAARLVIGGESAGGHLAALTLLRLRDRFGGGSGTKSPTGPFVAANLVFGVFDLSMTPSQLRWGDRNLILSTPIMAWFYDQFVPGTTLDERRSPTISPLYADLAGMPPALFSVGALDVLLDDTLFMAQRWQSAGSPAELLVYPESVHGFTGFPMQIAGLANEAQWRFVEKAVAS